jgi:chromosome partitioning protein
MSNKAGMRTIAVHALKGGVGKSTFAVNLAWASAMLSQRRTLLWDLDPQGAATWLMNPTNDAKDAAQAVFTKEVEPRDLIRATDFAGLDLLAADDSLHGLERRLMELGKRKRLARLLATIDKRYDRVLLDCPPGLNETSEQMLLAADLLVVPVIPSPLVQKTLDDLASLLVRRGTRHPPILPVFSMVDRRRSVHQAALDQHPDWPVLPCAAVVEQMGTQRLPIGAYAPDSVPARAFAALWVTIEQHLSAQQ